MLRHLERVLHPRWPTPVEATKRLVGAVVVILSVGVHSDTPEQRHSRFGDCLDRACLYRDGSLLSIALLAAAIVLMLVTAAAWEMLAGAKWFIDFW